MAGAIAPTSTGLNMVAFMTGVNADGTLNAQNGWSWTGSSTAVAYSSSAGSAHDWGKAATITVGLDTAYAWTASQTHFVQQALALWSAVANVTFQLATYSTAKVKVHRPATGGTDADDTYRNGRVGSTSIPVATSGIVNFTTANGYGQLDSYTNTGGYGPDATIHEFGHILGLMHSGTYNGAAIPSRDQSAPEDTTLGSIMSYFGPADSTAKYYQPGTDWTAADGQTYSPQTPMQYDILAIQRLYGTPTTTPLSGGQTFGFNNNTGLDAFDFTKVANPIVTIWDAGIGNTLDLSGFATASTIDLNPGAFSSANGMANNIAIAFGTHIERAVGGAGDDTFTLNLSNDTIDGGGGSNTAIMPGALAQYSFGFTNNALTATPETTGIGATSTLRNIQQLQFSDGTTTAATALPHRIDTTDAATSVSANDDGTAYTGPVSYLHWQYIWSSPDGVALRSNAPSAFLKGGNGSDALQATSGSNVLDGGLGSNFLVGSTGADGGTDTFFADARGGGITWSTAVNFHKGDFATFWGFVAGTSTYTWKADDGAAGYTGATIHATTRGTGNVDASFTFAGMTLPDAQSKLSLTTGNVSGNDYMLIQFTG